MIVIIRILNQNYSQRSDGERNKNVAYQPLKGSNFFAIIKWKLSLCGNNGGGGRFSHGIFMGTECTTSAVCTHDPDIKWSYLRCVPQGRTADMIFIASRHCLHTGDFLYYIKFK
jgi:hypothetical protein